jgi:NAD+ kinase
MSVVERPSSSVIARVGLVAKAQLYPAAEILAEIARWLEARGVQPVFETETAALAAVPVGRPTRSRDALPAHVDLVLVLGGDGTLIGMADRIAQAGVDIPILGINFGSLGFLTEVTLAELYPSLQSTLDGTAQIDERLMLRAEILRGTDSVSDRVVLNDVVITRGALSRIIDLSVSIDDQFVARFKADGIILASPTGSTAYNLASGGPIIHPRVDAIALTPIAPHILTNRPIVIPATSFVCIQPLTEGRDEVYVTFDGQVGVRLEREDIVRVTHSGRTLRLVRASERTYYEVLRQKLKWAER